MSDGEVPIFVAQGSYGAVFRPAKDLDGKLIPGTVAKVFGTSKSISLEMLITVEIRQNLKIKQFDPQGEFTLLSPLSFKEMEIPINHYDLSSVKRPEVWNGCDIFHQLIYKDGGDDLETIFKSKNIADYFLKDATFSISSLVSSFRPLFQSLITMSNAHFAESESIGFCHMDISEKNIVIDKESKIKLIDFGIGKEFDQCYKESADYFENYHYYPPELKLFAVLNDQRPFSFRKSFIEKRWRIKDGQYSINEFRKKFLSNPMLNLLMESPILFHKYSYHLDFFSDLFSFKTLPRERQIIEMINDFFFSYSEDFLDKEIDENPEDDEIWIETKKDCLGIPASYSKFYNLFHQQLPKIDVYALGLVLIRTIGNCVKSNLIKIEEIPVQLIQLLDSMTNFNCFRRIGPKKSLTELDQIIEILDPQLDLYCL